MFFFFLTIVSTLFLISSSSWFNIWIWLEINLISFIAILINNKNKLSIEASLLYFLIQSIASIILLFSFIIISFYYNFIIIIILSILLKLGRAPFHYWIPLIIEGLDWIKIFLLLTWQKINPLVILYYNYIFNLLIFFIIISLILGSISGLNFSSLKKIISFSSINQIRWIILRLINNKLFKIYIIFYFFLIWIIIKSIILFNVKYLNQLYSLNLKNKFLKIFIFINFLSLGGLPPFLGFYPKLMIIIKTNNFIIILLIIIFTIISLFIYLRIIFSFLILNSIKINLIIIKLNFKKTINLINFIILNNFFLLLLLFLY